MEEYFAELKNFIKKPEPELSELFKKDWLAIDEYMEQMQ
ncbi:hypothetical protein FVEN_g12985 [Fusarium venenatum]|nr:hypothetical protein FVEN_g12985 [Fusarium venenatum]